jgi:hypothetical protein
MTHAELLKATAEIAVRFGRSAQNACVAITVMGVPKRWLSYSLIIDDDCVCGSSPEEALDLMASKLAGMSPATDTDMARRVELLGDVAKEAA